MQIPMSMLENGAFAVIKSLGLNKDLSKKLFDLGIMPEAQFSVVKKSKSLVIKLNELKLALDCSFCDHIMVEEIAS